ncbi:hypothetical protein QEN19_000249 [Hanseniaspora menglaensis]
MSEEADIEAQTGAEPIIAVEDMRPPTRFEIEIEFVNSLSNINYLNYLIKNKSLLQDDSFLRYLKYLYVTYGCNIDFKKYIIYPNSLVLLKIIVDGMNETGVDVDRVLQEVNDPQLFKTMYERFKEK